MRSLVVIENTKRWEVEVEGAEVVSARSYLTEPRFAEMRSAAVFNLCRHYGYQTLGYYVSLLAEARGHRTFPPVATLQEMREDVLVRLVAEELEPLVDRSFAPLKSDRFELSVYFGRNLAQRYERLSRALFNAFPIPLMRAWFEKHDEHWRLTRVRPVATAEIPDDHRDFVLAEARRFFSRPRKTSTPRPAHRFDLAVLWSPDDPQPPSDERAIRAFEKAFDEADIGMELLDRQDMGHLPRFDALFIRETTRVDHHTYRFARRAEAEGMVVVDDPDSIVRCTNKVFQHEVFRRHDVAAPRTVIVQNGGIAEAAATVGFPCVLKKPDGAFSQGVSKVSSQEELEAALPPLLAESSLVVVQAWTPSSFDWRIGVLDGKPLWAARYHMVPGHWQIASRGVGGTRYGRVEAVALDAVTPGVVELAVRAAALMGGGLYGVDLKEVDGRPLVMEVNDNPNIESGCEDMVAGAELYRAIAGWFRARMEARGRGGAPGAT